MTKRFYYSIVLCCVTLIPGSCSLFDKEEEGRVVARVNEHVLTEEEIAEALNNNFGTDSAMTIQAYMNDWATNKLLIDGALRNLSSEDQSTFEALVEGYRTDLYTKHYKDALVQQQMDSVVSDQDAEIFYNENQNNFLLNEKLVQFRFIQVDRDYTETRMLRNSFVRFNEEDRYLLDSLQFQYKNHFLNDSIWVKQNSVVRQIHVVTPSNADQLLKKTNFLQLRDSLGLYLIAIKNALGRNDIAPLEYVRPTIDQIIKNRRKVELIKKLEKEIKDDAIKNKKFEIYN